VNLGWPGFIETKDNGSGGDNWSYKTCKAPVKSSPPTNQHPIFLTVQMPFLSPNQHPACKKTECWYADGRDMIGALHVLIVLTGSSTPSVISGCSKIQNGSTFWYQLTVLLSRTFLRSQDKDRDLGLQVSRQRPRPGQNELECT